jgi:hypothetical protein
MRVAVIISEMSLHRCNSFFDKSHKFILLSDSILVGDWTTVLLWDPVSHLIKHIIHVPEKLIILTSGRIRYNFESFQLVQARIVAQDKLWEVSSI